jgi:hypothetical protein
MVICHQNSKDIHIYKHTHPDIILIFHGFAIKLQGIVRNPIVPFPSPSSDRKEEEEEEHIVWDFRNLTQG